MINIVFYKLFLYFEIFIFYLIAIKRDVTFFIKMAYLIIKSILYKYKNLTTADIFLENVKKNPNKAIKLETIQQHISLVENKIKLLSTLHDENRKLTLKQIENFINQLNDCYAIFF